MDAALSPQQRLQAQHASEHDQVLQASLGGICLACISANLAAPSSVVPLPSAAAMLLPVAALVRQNAALLASIWQHAREALEAVMLAAVGRALPAPAAAGGGRGAGRATHSGSEYGGPQQYSIEEHRDARAVVVDGQLVVVDSGP